jgi:hypothetical protein
MIADPEDFSHYDLDTSFTGRTALIVAALNRL